MSKKNQANISLDLDNKWSYLKTQGGDEWQGFPSYLDYAVPRVLNFLGSRKLKITVFVIGQDAVLPKNKAAIESIDAAGHEIANHSFNHEPWLHLYTPAELISEFEKTENALKAITGKLPVGFRGPGFSVSDEVFRTMMNRGYRYDGSTFPTYLGPVARAYTFFKSKLSREQKEERKVLFGSWRDCFRSNQPFMWTDGDRELLEIPVTTMPIFKVPIHGSYVLFLAGYSKRLAKTYFWMAMKLCRLLGVQPSLLLHPLDFLGRDDEPDLSFFPAMNQLAVDKVEIMASCVDMLTENFNVLTMREHAESLSATKLNRRTIESAVMGAKDLAREWIRSRAD
jgi:hypothetical protein